MDIPHSKAVAAYKQSSGMSGGMGSDNVSIGKKIKSIAGAETMGGVQAASAANGQPSFPDLVAQGLDKARAAGYNSEATSTSAIANKAELHDLVTSVSNAELTLNTIVGIRDRMINAYQDIIKMPI